MIQLSIRINHEPINIRHRHRLAPPYQIGICIGRKFTCFTLYPFAIQISMNIKNVSSSALILSAISRKGKVRTVQGSLHQYAIKTCRIDGLIEKPMVYSLVRIRMINTLAKFQFHEHTNV